MKKPEPFAVRLKRLRLSAGMTQYGLAKAAGVASPTILRYEDGTRRPTLEVASRIARALNVSLDEFS